MKKYILFIAVICSALLFSCNKEEELDANQFILGLGGEKWTTSEIDLWLQDNFTKELNMEVLYRWDLSEVNSTYTLVPIQEQRVIPVMKAVKKAWIDTYRGFKDPYILEKYSPKKFVLIGSPAYKDGSITLGTAEGARKISLFRLNWFSIDNMVIVREIAKTCHHEFGHILHQNIYYPYRFKEISASDYNAAWTGYSEDEALKLGFVSKYSISGADEDFVETLSLIVTQGRAWFDARVAAAQALWDDPLKRPNMEFNPAEKLREKEEIMVDYMQSVWGVNIYTTPEGAPGLEENVQKALYQISKGDY